MRCHARLAFFLLVACTTVSIVDLVLLATGAR
jgi:hypothetical protein